MTLNNLFYETLHKYPKIQRCDLYELVYFLSSNITDESKIALFLTKEIDFSYDDFYKLIESHFSKFKPINRITNNIKFRNTRFILKDDVFAPRPETFYWCDKLVQEIVDKKFKNYIDLCCGSGFIAIYLSKNLKIDNSFGIDINNSAISLSKKNAILNNVNIKFEVNDFEKWILNNKIEFDLLTCNPPYIDASDKNIDLSALIYDPLNSLFAKNNGLYFYEVIIKNILKILNTNGMIIFEIGYNQKEKLTKILKKEKIKKFIFEKDEFNEWRTLKIIKE